MNDQLYNQIQDAVAFIRTHSGSTPPVGIILGTGLGNLANEIESNLELPYSIIPHFPVSTVQGHKGKLIIGRLGNKEVVAMAGRFHFYEGYSLRQVTFPIRVMKALGVELLVLSNAAGSVNPQMEAGDMVFINGHIDMLPDNPLIGQNDDRLGVRFPDMLHTYDTGLIDRAFDIAKRRKFRAHVGIYTCLQGPNLETPAEYRFIHSIGSDLVGMSTVPEAIVARQSGMKVFAVSVVSNKCYPLDEIQETSLEDVLRVVEAAEPRVSVVVKELIGTLEG
jgi:purine-nucleoside phosphorylase